MEGRARESVGFSLCLRVFVRAKQHSLFRDIYNQDPDWNTTHFNPLGTIDTTSQTINHFTATSLTPTQCKTLGSYRWILWKVHPLNDSGENTAFQEFAVEISE